MGICRANELLQTFQFDPEVLFDSMVPRFVKGYRRVVFLGVCRGS